MKISRHVFVPMLLVFLLVTGILVPLAGQDDTVITLAVPAWISDLFNQELLEQFYAENPGVKVVLKQEDNQFFPPPAFAFEEYMEGIQGRVANADVLYIESMQLMPEATRAGYFLNLMPLAESDPEFNRSDFINAALESFEWDRGLWAVPVSASVEILVYDIDAFDEAGLAYPSPSWTLQDLINAAEQLTIRSEDGLVQVPGYTGYNLGALLYSTTGVRLYDPSTVPAEPDFSSPELVAALETWAAFQEDIRNTSTDADFNATPLTYSQPWRLVNSFNTDSRRWAGALLPGGGAGLSLQGFAVSAGTEQPEAAYELVKFLSKSPQVANRFFGNTPARYSLFGVETDNNMFIRPEIPADVQALIDEAIANAIPTSEIRFADYLQRVMGEMSANDTMTALEIIETEARENLLAAEQRGQETILAVATPIPTPVIGEGEIVMRFGLNLYTSQIPNRDQWEQRIAEFIATNPRVGNIDLVTQGFNPQTLDNIDCYYQPTNDVGSLQFETLNLLNLDPFMDVDPTFNPDDFIGNVLQEVQRDNRTWAYPIVLQPGILWYNTERFDEAGAIHPEGGWTVEVFEDALNRLDAVAEDDEPIFVPETFDATYLLMLMTAYGGIPYDYRTDPPTVNFTDPDTLNAVREVLDLARSGYIAYQELQTFGGSSVSGGSNPAITTDNLSPYTWRLQNRDDANFAMPYQLTNYPHGTEYIPVSYSLGTAYINADSQNPEACYEWITTLASHSELFVGVPARHSLIDASDIALRQGEDVAALYQEFAQLLEAPNVVAFPGQYGGSTGNSLGAFVEPYWMHTAFNDYVLNNVDIETAMQQAQTDILTYRDCTGNIPAVDVTQFIDDPEAGQAYFRQFIDCAVAITPELREQFSFYYQEDEQ